MIKINEVIQSFLKACPEMSNTKMAKDILDEYPDLNISVRTLRRKIAYSRNQVKEISVPVSDNSEEKYFVSEDYYNIYSKHGLVKMSIEFVDNIFTRYARKGYDRTGDEVMAEFDLQPHEWIALKNALNLYKTSEIVSPYTIENTPKEDLEELIEGRIRRLFRDRGAITKKYNDVLQREYKNVINKNLKREAELSRLVSEIYSNLDVEQTINTVSLVNHSPKRDVGVFVISDIHFGARINQTKTIPHFTMFDVEKSLMNAAEVINSYDFKEVHLLLLGDLIHTFTGDLHHEMWREVDVEEGIGGKLIVNTVNLITRFSSKIINLKSIDGVDGNHDRHSKDKQRVGQELSYIIYEMLSRSLGIHVQFHNKRGIVCYGGMNFILSHGDHPFDSKDVYRMINRFGNPKGFTLVLKGHKHSRMIEPGADNYDNRRMFCPSFFTFDHYTEDLGFKSAAGFIIIEPGETDGNMVLPVIHDHTIRV